MATATTHPPSEPSGLDPDDALVRRIRAGDTSAVEDLLDEVSGRLFRFVRSRLRRADAADPELTRDLVQTALCRALASIDTFRGDSRLFTWLCACCRNEILMHYRRASHRMVHLDWSEIREGEELCAPGRTDRRLERAEAGRIVHETLDRLPRRYGDALEWKYIDRLPVRDIAGRLHCGEKAAESLLARARSAFRIEYRRVISGRHEEPGT